MRAQLTAALLLLSTLAVADDNSLVGKWESVARNDAGIGSTLQLNADGSLARTLGQMLDFTYTFDGRKLRVSSLDPDSGRAVTNTYKVRLAGDSLFERNGGGSGVDITMTRLTRFDIARPLVGTWSYPHTSGATAFVTFTADGHEYVRIPMRVDGGSWVAADGKLTLRVDGVDPVTSTFRIDHNVLSLVEAGKEFRYRRVRY